MKNKFKVLFILMFLFVTATTVAVIAEDPVDSSFNFSFETQIGNNTPVVTDLGNKTYGSSVTIDAGTYNPSYEFATYIVNDKVEFEYGESHAFLVTEELDVIAIYKPANTYMVAFMLPNQTVFASDIQFVTDDGTGDATPPSTSGLVPIPGYKIDTTTPWLGGSYIDVLQDTVLWVNYISDNTDSFTVTTTNGTVESAVYDYNEVATVTASGTGYFQYWQKDGMIVSINPSYSFTVFETTDITAVYDPVTASPDPDGLFIGLLPFTGLIDEITTYVGQFNLPTGHSMVEYGVITSVYPGGITLNTPDVEKIQSYKYNLNTGEFVRHLDSGTYDSQTVRGYMITTDGVDETISYSQMASGEYATELFISEYIEGSSYNKSIEIYNGTNADVDLSTYAIRIYFGGSLTASGDIPLSGTLVSGDVFVVSDNTSVQAVLDETDLASTASFFNGDDAVTLEKNGVDIDVIGVIGEDLGSSWPIGTGSTLDHTLVRKSSVTSPTTSWDTSEWHVYDEDTFYYLGFHNYPLPINNPTSVTITGSSSVLVGSSIDLDVDILPIDTLDAVQWFSSDNTIASIDPDGIVTGISAGTVTITVISTGNHNVQDTLPVDVTSPTSFTVAYEENGGTLVPDETGIAWGEYATEPAAPTKLNHTFDGWYYEPEFTTQHNFEYSPIILSITLYAKWIPDAGATFSVTVDSAGQVTTYIPEGNIDSYLSLTNTSIATLSTDYIRNSASTHSIFNNTSFQIRLYAGSTDGGQLTFDIGSGYIITSITVNTTTNGGFSINDGTVNTINTSDGTNTISLGAGVQVVTLQNVSASDQVRMDDIVIEYEVDTGGAA